MKHKTNKETAQALRRASMPVFCLPVKDILDLLAANDFYDIHEYVEIAKGCYKLPRTWRATFKNLKRQTKWRKK